MKTFIWNNGKAEAMRSYNDDLVMACSIGCWVRDTALIENQRNAEYKKAILGSMRTSNTTINTSIPGMRSYKKDGVFDKMNQTKKTHEQFPWLFKG